MRLLALLRRFTAFANERRHGAADAPVGQRFRQAMEQHARAWCQGEELDPPARRPWWDRADVGHGSASLPRSLAALLRGPHTDRGDE